MAKTKPPAVANAEVEPLPPDNFISADVALAIIDALAGPVTKTKENVLVVDSLPLVVAEALIKLVAAKQLKEVKVGKQT